MLLYSNYLFGFTHYLPISFAHAILIPSLPLTSNHKVTGYAFQTPIFRLSPAFCSFQLPLHDFLSYSDSLPLISLSISLLLCIFLYLYVSISQCLYLNVSNSLSLSLCLYLYVSISMYLSL